MANVKISALPAVTTVVPATDVLPLVSGGITTKATPNDTVNAVLVSPGAIGSTTANTGKFTTLTATSTTTLATSLTGLLKASSGVVSTATAGTDYTTPTGTENLSNKTITASSLNSTPVGASSASTGAFTTISASSTVSGTGFSNYLASPPSIGSSVPASGNFTTLTATGNFLAGQTSLSAGNMHGLTNSNASGVLTLTNSANNSGLFYYMGPNNSAAAPQFNLQNQTGTGVYIAYGGTAWTAASDERLKTNLNPIENATQKVLSLRSVTGRYKNDEENISRSFLIAQDVLAVLPEAVDSTNPDKLGVAYADVIPLLVAAIKEIANDINEIKTKVSVNV